MLHRAKLLPEVSTFLTQRRCVRKIIESIQLEPLVGEEQGLVLRMHIDQLG